jgi:hypothetical protein
MTDPMNPYAPPQARLDVQAPTPEGYWRDGKVLVMLNGSLLPDRCVKCNAPADLPTKPRKMYWHHPAIYIIALFALLIYAIVAIIVRKQAVVNVGLCAEHKRRRIWGLSLGAGGLLLGIVIMIVGAANDACGFALFGLLLFLAGLIAAARLSRLLYPVEITEKIARFKGCGEAFLDGLPSLDGRG